ncbi:MULTISPECIES: DUF6010 family protein [Streptomyces]|uniref:DUF6010 family protein n=1 Tax=Streptomyces flaveolus TaxID=67297 RepID=A0ABV3AAT0_9ACTN|nr:MULTISPECIES: DUF6010 family protein [unclassified Streptomyces]KOV99659.1 membrane protein [Streptomyces sp. NRRL WC-3723]MBG7703511.1 hypothetical protein [Streptomyces sp. MC1]
MRYLAPLLIGLLYVTLMSLVPEPHRRRLNAVMVAGAGAAYLSGGGLGGWEFAFTAVATYVAYKGLDSWAFIGVGWLLHTAWDVVHHLKGHPIVPFAHDSSFGCALCDPVIALWCLGGGRAPWKWSRRTDEFPRARRSALRTQSATLKE